MFQNLHPIIQTVVIFGAALVTYMVVSLLMNNDVDPVMAVIIAGMVTAGVVVNAMLRARNEQP